MRGFRERFRSYAAQRRIDAATSDNPLTRDARIASKYVARRLTRLVPPWPYQPGELHLMTVAVLATEPEVICEWGTNAGVSAKIFHHIARDFDLKAIIHSVDLPPTEDHVENVVNKRGIYVRGLSDVHLHLGDGLEVSKRIAKGKRALFFVDGDHRRATVARELLELSAEFPSSGILLHDTCVVEDNDNPWAAIRDFEGENPGKYRRFDVAPTAPGMTLLLPVSA